MVAPAIGKRQTNPQFSVGFARSYTTKVLSDYNLIDKVTRFEVIGPGRKGRRKSILERGTGRSLSLRASIRGVPGKEAREQFPRPNRK